MMFRLLSFELRYHFSQLTFWIAAVIFLGMGCLLSYANFGSDAVHANSPYVFAMIVSLLSLFCLFVCTIFCANVVLRDATYSMESVIFTTSLKRSTFFLVRFIGLVFAVLIILSLAIIGLLLTSSGLPPEKTGPLHLAYFIQPLFTIGLPNILFSGALLYITALLTKSTRAIYAAGVLMYVFYLSGSILGNSPLLGSSAMKLTEHDILPYLIDPFGLAAFFGQTRQWTDLQRNTQLFPVEGMFLLNRCLWLAVTGCLLFAGYRFFKFSTTPNGGTKKKSVDSPFTVVPFKPVAVFPQGILYQIRTFNAQLSIEVVSLFKHIPFMVMLALWVFIFGVELNDSVFRGPYNIEYYPLTGIIVEAMRPMQLGLIFVIFYTTELLSREKSIKMDRLIYSSPVSYAALWGAKCATLCLLVLVLITANIGVGIALQFANGYSHFDFKLYLSLYYYSGMPLMLFAFLFAFIQNLTSNKYLGMFLCVLVAFVFIFPRQLGLEHPMFRFAGSPDLLYSYFNGFGHYANAFNWYMAFWIGVSAILGVFTVNFWQNGTPFKLKTWFKNIVRLSRYGVVLLVISALTIACGVYLFKQINITGKYSNAKASRDWSAFYEKKYKQFENLPVPVITSVKTAVELYPEDRKYTVKGQYTINNTGDLPIQKFLLQLDAAVQVFDIKIKGAISSPKDLIYNNQWIQLESPLLSGDELIVNFSFTVIRSGFMPFDSENSVVANGSYIELEKFLPSFGYDASIELEDPTDRKKVGLSPQKLTYPADQRRHLVNYESVISVPEDQQVVSVGDMVKTERKAGRASYHFKTKQPINFMFAFSAAKYAIAEDTYKDVAIRVYYLPEQSKNVQAMLKAAKSTLAYCSKNFGDYPLKTLNIAAIPQYRGAATAYPGVIFAAERINFLGNFESPDNVNHGYAILAHEIAHQWWANMLIPMDAPGRAMLTESLAKYTEALIIEKDYGKTALQKLMQADNQLYFVYRYGGKPEEPLATVLGQPQVYYQKGMLAFFRLKELIGEQKLNKMLHDFTKQHVDSDKKAYPTALIARLKTAAPDISGIINELFEQVVTYDMKIHLLESTPTKGGKFLLKLAVEVEKTQGGVATAIGDGISTDIAVYNGPAASQQLLLLKKYHFTQKRTIVEILADSKPTSVSLDPLSYILDINLSDNTVVVK